MPKSVFVIDDSATMRRVFEMTFLGEDIAVHTHGSADGALAMARELRPNAVIVDVNLAGGSSYELVKSLRGDAGLGTVPVFFLYSDHSPLDEGAARAAGAQGAVLKPFDSQAMIDRVRSAITGVPIATPAATSMTASRAGTAAPAQKAMATNAPSMPRPPTPPHNESPKSPPPLPPSAKSAPEEHHVEPDLAPPPKVAQRPSNPDVAISMPTPVVAVHSSDIARTVADRIHSKTAALGLTPAQVEAVTALTRDVVERVVWEVVPTLAETIIREELKRLTA